MKRYRIFIVGVLLIACSPQVNSATVISSSTATQLKATNTFESPHNSPTPIVIATTTPTPSKLAELDFELPPDCGNFDASIDSIYYHDLSHGACNHPALSPDGSQVAYASLTITEAGEIVQEARLFSKSFSEAYPIYTSKCGILHPEWTLTGQLVISDSAQDVGCGHTIIYDMTNDEIITVLNGAVSSSGKWSADKNSFFTVSPQLFGPACSETLSGFDIIANQPIPIIKPITPNTNLYVVIGDPVWSADNKSLLAVLRDGICSNPENNECTYRNAYIISIAFSEATPAISYPFYNPTTDYSFTKSNEGSLEINSNPFETINCMEVQIEEAK